MLTRTIDYYREETKETLVSTCRLFGVNRQVYYRQKRAIKKKQDTASRVVEMVMVVRQQMPRIGTRKLYYLLQDQLRDLGVGRDKLFTILSANHMLIKPKRCYRKTTNSNHWYRKHKNLIESVVPVRPEQIWASDITYLGNNSNYSYLALVTDTYSKKIVGYDLSTSLSADGAIRALKMGLRQRSYKKERDVLRHPLFSSTKCINLFPDVLQGFISLVTFNPNQVDSLSRSERSRSTRSGNRKVVLDLSIFPTES